MNIAVLVKEVPDTWGERRLDPVTARIDRRGDNVLDEIAEKAVEVALRVAEENPGSEVTVVTMGPASALDALRRALAMGAHRALHIVDDRLAGSDAVQTSAAIAAVLEGKDFDLVIAGNTSTDGSTSALPAMLAERLGFAQATNLRGVRVESDRLSGERVTTEGDMTLSAPLPAVVSVTEQVADARFPNLRGILGAKKKPVDVLRIEDLGLDAGVVGGEHSPSVVLAVTERPPRTAGTVVDDDGASGERIVEFLRSRRLA